MAEHKLAYGRAQLDRATLADGAPMTFVASTNKMNRYGYALRNDGWRLDNYNANPVVLWMHNVCAPPIGKGVALSKSNKIILDKTEFDTEDELGAAVDSKYRRGFLSAVSVSWDFTKKDGTPVLDWWRLSNDEIQNEMFYDLCEVSAVTVPGDPRAVAKQSRLALVSLGKELVELFDEQEHGSITKPELQAAVAAELERLGIDLTALGQAPRTGPKADPDEPPGLAPEDVHPAADEPVGVDQDAARNVLAAFALQEEETIDE
ncbi:MAG TPA: hypothetical protein VGP26_24620 [Actinophytocola sp.]|jgi:hypothetical protein|nr:hypothetical protein [Actinophytocola sp.]